MFPDRSFIKLTIIILTTLFSTMLVSCMLGPDFKSPLSPNTKKYTHSPSPTKIIGTPGVGKAGKTQYLISGKDIPGEWWRLFHSTEINDLINRAFENNPNLAAAKAALRQAQETLRAQIAASLFPILGGQLTVDREKFSGSQFGLSNLGGGTDIFTLYNTTVNVSYTLDFFGGLRRQIESLCAQVDFQRFQLEGVYLSLTANVITTAITAAALHDQIKATRELIHAQEKQLEITKKQFGLGGVNMISVLSQQTQLAELEASLPPLLQNYDQAMHALAVLVGDLPSESQLPKLDLNKIDLPTKIPLSIPSNLIRQRPDIRAAEAMLHSASAQIGVATANLFPQINLTAFFGYESDRLNTLFTTQSNIWLLGGNVLQTIFDAGALRAKRRSTIAAFTQILEQYRQTVLLGFQNVADTLRALEHDAQALQAHHLAEISARENLKLVTQQFNLGGASYLALLISQVQYEQAVIRQIQAQAARLNDTVALFAALGGGWWNRIETIESEIGTVL